MAIGRRKRWWRRLFRLRGRNFAARFLPLAFLVGPSVALSLSIIPGRDELGQLDAEAGRIDRAIERLEEAATDGRHLASTVATLARARAEMGDIEGAIRDLERLRRSRPDDIALLRALLQHYEGLGMLDEHAAVLRDMQEIEPEADRQRLLVRLAAEHGDVRRQRAELRVLIDAFEPRFPDYIALAELEAAAGNPAAAAEALADIPARFSRRNRFHALSLEMVFLVAAGQTEKAVQRGTEWLAETERPGREGPALSELLVGQARPDLAVRLLDDLARQPAAAQLLAAYARALYLSDRKKAALRVLERLEAERDIAGRVPPLLRLQLALSLSSSDHVVRAAHHYGLTRVPSDLLGPVAAAAVHIKDRATLKDIADLGRETLHAIDPIMVAEIFLMIGDRRTAAGWSDMAEAQVAGNVARSLYFADVELRLGRVGKARAVLDTLFRPGAVEGPLPLVSSDQLDDLAYLYLRAGQPRQGLRTMEVLRQEQPSIHAERAWALTALASGKSHAVARWLQDEIANDLDLSPAYLKDMVHLATRVQGYGLAADLAEELVARRGTDADKLLLAHARLAAGRPWTTASLASVVIDRP